MGSLSLCWGTRTRTKNDRTRICSVTITPYPNVLICGCKGTAFFGMRKNFNYFFCFRREICFFFSGLEVGAKGFFVIVARKIRTSDKGRSYLSTGIC